jgi:hypothetical protein
MIKKREMFLKAFSSSSLFIKMNSNANFIDIECVRTGLELVTKRSSVRKVANSKFSTMFSYLSRDIIF